MASQIEPVDGKIIIGAFDPIVKEGQTEFERKIGQDVAVVVLYQPWQSKFADFPSDWVTAVADAGKVPMITWEPWKFSTTDFDQPEYRLKNIADGKHDKYIRDWISAARDWRGPVMVRFAHEMNGDWYPWGDHVNEPDDYIAAWRHVVDMSREIGAKNITWVWSPNELRGNEELAPYYPGDDYVDWIGVSGFNWPGVKTWQKWRSFEQIFDNTLEQLKEFNKPLMIAEIGADENPQTSGETKAAWIAKTFTQVKKNDPPISMIIWFNGVGEIGGEVYDWRINKSPENIDAMKKALDDPVFLDSVF